MRRQSNKVSIYLLLILLPVCLPLSSSFSHNLTVTGLGIVWVLGWFYLGGRPLRVEPAQPSTTARFSWGVNEWLTTIIFLGVQSLFIFDPLLLGRNYQSDIIAASINAADWGSTSLGVSWVIAAGVTLFVVSWCLIRFVPRRYGPVAVTVGVTALVIAGIANYGLAKPLTTAGSPALPVILESFYLTLTGINTVALKCAAMALTVGAGFLLHRLVWMAFGHRLGGVAALAVCYFNPALFHFTHTGIRFPAFMFLSVWVFYNLYIYLKTGRGRAVCWAALVLLFLWHPMMMWGLLIIGTAIIAGEAQVNRWERVKLLLTPWLVALGIYGWQVWNRGAIFSSWLLAPGAWDFPQRLVLPWLALPSLITHALTVVVLLGLFALLIKQRGAFPLVLALWLIFLLSFFYFDYLQWPLLVQATFKVLFFCLTMALFLVVGIVAGGGLERLLCTWMFGFPAVAMLTPVYGYSELWLFALPAIILLVGRTAVLLVRFRHAAWAMTVFLSLTLLGFSLWGGRAEWVNLRTREFYHFPWPQMATVLKELPPGSGIYSPPPTTPLLFYFAQAGLLDRLRLDQEPWSTPSRQTLDYLYEFCVARNYRFVVLPRHFLVGDEFLEGRETMLSQLEKNLLPGQLWFSTPGGASLQGYLKPDLVEKLLFTIKRESQK